MSETKWQKAEPETKRPSLSDERFANWCVDSFEDQKDRYHAFVGEQSRWIDILESRLLVSEAAHTKLQGIIEMKTIKIEALQLAILSIYKPQIQILERRLELIKKYIEELSGWCGDEGCRAFKELGVLLSEPKELDQKTREGDIK